MNCFLCKKKKKQKDIYTIVKDNTADIKSNMSSEIDKETAKTPVTETVRTEFVKRPLPLPSTNSPSTNSPNANSPAKRSTRSVGSSIWNFRNRKKKETVEYIDVDPLYVIVPYFNYCGFKRRKELFLQFYNRIKDNPRIRIVICEAAEYGTQFELPTDLPNIFLHIHVNTTDQIWIKENLVNIAVRRLPHHWKYFAWLDSDIHFVEEDWVEKTIERFEKYDVVQLFSTLVYLGPNNEAIKTDRGFGYMYRRSGKAYTQTYRYGFWHPGFAWACTKEAYYTMDGLIDYAVLGSGDHHMALGLISKVECSHPKNIHPTYRKLLKDFERRVRTLRLGYVDGTVLHYWHGDLKLRRYKERWQILTENKYDPLIDVYRDPMGLYQLTEAGKKLDRDIRDYFAGRLEDDTRVLS